MVHGPTTQPARQARARLVPAPQLALPFGLTSNKVVQTSIVDQPKRAAKATHLKIALAIRWTNLIVTLRSCISRWPQVKFVLTGSSAHFYFHFLVSLVPASATVNFISSLKYNHSGPSILHFYFHSDNLYNDSSILVAENT